MDAFSRTKLLIGEDKFNILKNCNVALFGVGGVGGFVAEALVRSGIGSISVVDGDAVAESNLNRQIIATRASIGKPKTEVIKERLLSINPSVNVNCFNTFYLPVNAEKIDLSSCDYIVDAVDTVSAKIEIIVRAKALNIPVISCMGTGGKTDITKLSVSTVEKTSDCPLARVMRRELKKRNVTGVKVVYSKENPTINKEFGENFFEMKGQRTAPPSMIFVPAAAGLMLAREVVFDLINKKEEL